MAIVFFNMLTKRSKKNTMAYIEKIVSYEQHYSENENASQVVGTRNGSRLAFFSAPSFLFFTKCIIQSRRGHNMHVYGCSKREIERETARLCDTKRERVTRGIQ